MLLSNSRIEKYKNIRFYEQDILLDDHIYSGNIQVTIDVDYFNSGIGIALVSNEGLSLREDGETYLFRIGHSDYSIIRRTGSKTDVIESGAVADIKPFKSNLKLTIRKINNRVYFYANNALLSTKFLPSSLDTYSLGFYSNAGNVIHSIAVASALPDGWIVNMNNTNGGYITFARSSFSLTHCLDRAEVEQVKIPLKTNTDKNPYYYLKYEVDEDSDIKAYVFHSDDNRYIDTDKNILDKHNRFVIKQDREINIKFVGTKGTVKNIQITNSKDDFYVGTDYNSTEALQSYILIKTSELKKIEWSGTIHSTPDYNLDDPSMERFGIVRDSKKVYYPQQCNVDIGQKYDYEIDLISNNGKGILYKKGGVDFTTNLEINDSVIIFENMDAVINKLILYKKDGTVVNIILENTKKQYVPGAIKSPIIVVDDMNEPLDLSASYRIVNSTYVFTNIEREVFEPSNRLRLNSKVSNKLDAIVVYGIPNTANTYPDKIFYSKDANARDISSYCDSYELLKESDLYNINKDTGEIIISDQNDAYISNKYKEIVVDYLKRDSYAINYLYEMDSYEVDISTSSNTKMYYDGASSDNSFSNIQEYKLFNRLTLDNDSYIVMKGGV